MATQRKWAGEREENRLELGIDGKKPRSGKKNNVGFQIVETSKTFHDKLKKSRNVKYLIAVNC
jgi:hypothetical protein